MQGCYKDTQNFRATFHSNPSDKTCLQQGRSQDLNRPIQDIAQNFGNDIIIMTLTSLLRRQVKHEKFCAISLNILHTGGLCGVLRFTARLILISKKF